MVDSVSTREVRRGIWETKSKGATAWITCHEQRGECDWQEIGKSGVLEKG